MPLGWKNHKPNAEPTHKSSGNDGNTTEGEWGEHEIHHYHFAHLFELAVEVINTGAGILVIFAMVLALVNLCIVAANAITDREYMMINPLHSGHNRVATVVAIRLMLGELTALALGVLVAADVLETVIKPTHAYDMHSVLKMGFITVLRTGLAYFLAKEIKEQEEVLIVRSKSTLGISNLNFSTSHLRTSSSKLSPPSSDHGLAPSNSADRIDALDAKKTK